jgi:hypothetical protein
VCGGEQARVDVGIAAIGPIFFLIFTFLVLLPHIQSTLRTTKGKEKKEKRKVMIG